MGVMWTEQQQKVIDLRDRNILVSAAAGSGKTAVLVERIIQMLTDEKHPVDVDELLIVTFTEAAAGEMKERIRAAIENALEENPEHEHLKRQATLIHNAQITTIHSFCLSVIRDHFHAIDIDPGFRTAEEGELKLLRHDVLDDILEEKYAEKSERFLRLSNAYGGKRDDKKLEEMIQKAYDYSRSYPDGEGWLDACAQAYRINDAEDLENSDYGKKIVAWAKEYLKEAENLGNQALELSLEEDGPNVYEETLQLNLRTVSNLLQAENYQEMSENIVLADWGKLRPCRDKNVSKEKIEEVKNLREQMKDIVDELKDDYFYQSPQEMAKDMKICFPYMEELVELVKRFAKRFDEKKRQENIIDFSDMEQFALQILAKKTEDGFEPSEVAKEYQEQFREIMIDEYQDSNLIQETILTSISGISKGKYNIFMVGDVKQSIYSFRLSRPELFMEKFDTYDQENGPKQRIDLHKNFRSRKEVLDSVNYIFKQIMLRDLGEIDYDDQAALYVGADYPENPGCETEVLVLNTDQKAYDYPVKASKQELEARMIAARIRSLMEQQKVLDKKTGELRPVKYSDIVVLTRNMKGIADVFVQELNREGIPAFSGTKEGYFATQEIGVLLDYLRILDNRKQDIPLAAVLTSAFCGLDGEEMAIIRSSEGTGIPFYQAVESYLEKGENEEIRRKLKALFGKMDEFRKIVPYTPIHELLRKILAQTGYEQFISAMPGGVQRQANVDMLITKAQAFQSTSYKGLFHFIRYMEQLQKFEVDCGEASLEDENSDTVRVMTIHKSKGLEFPIVFVSGTGKKFNQMDLSGQVIIHARLGVGMDTIDLEKRTKIPSLVKKVIQNEATLDSLGEELRVLYVALTRAKEKLIITGTCDNLKLKFEKTLTYAKRSKAIQYLDWIIPALKKVPSDIPIIFKEMLLEDLVSEEVETEAAGYIQEEILRRWDTNAEYDANVRQTIDEQFSYQYQYPQSNTRKMKFTVSELKKMAYQAEMIDDEGALGEIVYEEPEVVPLLPKFLSKEEVLTGASRGTAYHRVMELIDFRQNYDSQLLNDTIETFVSQGRMTREMADSVQTKDVLKFLCSSVGKRMRVGASCGKLWKEQPFVLGIPEQELYPDEPEGEFALVQGIIDVYFEEEDGLVVLDYKTDKIYRIEELAEKYHAQLNYYGRALEQITGKKVKEKVLYSFTLGEACILP